MLQKVDKSMFQYVLSSEGNQKYNQATPSVRSVSVGSGLDLSEAIIPIGSNSKTTLHIHAKQQEIGYFKTAKFYEKSMYNHSV